MDIDFGPIEKKLEELIKKKITDDGLVKTGTMRDSIKVSSTKEGFTVSGVDYFLYLNAEYNILGEVAESKEFLSYMENEIARQIEKQMNNELKK